MTEITETDRAPRAAGLDFPNPSGRRWHKEKTEDQKPETPKVPTRNETPAQRKAKVRKRAGKTYLGAAKLAGIFAGEYPRDVLLSQTESFNDALMGLCEEHPRVLDFLDSEYLVPATWQFVGVCTAITIPIAAYFGFVPPFIGDLVAGAFDVPQLPNSAERVDVLRNLQDAMEEAERERAEQARRNGGHE